MYAAISRDALLVVGTEIIECPMSWPSRYYESLAYHPLLKEYFKGGARWSAGPKTQLTDEQFDQRWTDLGKGGPQPSTHARIVLLAFADGVHPRRPRPGGDHPQPVGPEHRPGRGGENRIAIMNREPQRANAFTHVHGRVVGWRRSVKTHLRRPGDGVGAGSWLA